MPSCAYQQLLAVNNGTSTPTSRANRTSEAKYASPTFASKQRQSSSIPTAMTGRGDRLPLLLRVACKSTNSSATRRQNLLTRSRNAGFASLTRSPANSLIQAGNPPRANDPPTHGPIRSATLSPAAPAATTASRTERSSSNANRPAVGSWISHGTRMTTLLNPACRNSASTDDQSDRSISVASNDAATNGKRTALPRPLCRRKLFESNETAGMEVLVEALRRSTTLAESRMGGKRMAS